MECAAIWRERRALKMLLQVHRGRRRRVFFCPVEAAADAPRQRHVGALRVLLPIQQHNRHIQKRACGPRKALQEGFRGNAPPAPPRDGRGASSSMLQGAARSKRERTTACFTGVYADSRKVVMHYGDTSAKAGASNPAAASHRPPLRRDGGRASVLQWP